MLLDFLDALRAAGIPAGIKEHLLLLEALDRDVIARRPEEFYYLARATYVKDEGLFDRFDQVFGYGLMLYTFWHDVHFPLIDCHIAVSKGDV